MPCRLPCRLGSVRLYWPHTCHDGCMRGRTLRAGNCGFFPSWKEAPELLVATYRGWMADRAPRLGASLAFYTLLSMAPMIIVVVAIAGAAFGHAAAQGQLIWQIQSLVGWQGAIVIQGLLKSTQTPASGWIPTAIGLIALFFGASAVVNELRDALNTIWHVPTVEVSYWKSALDILKTRALSFAMVVAVGFLLMVSLLVNASLSALGAYFGDLLPIPAWAIQIAYTVLSFIVVAFLFALVFKLLPQVKLEWGDVIAGASGTSVLFTLGKVVIGFYLGRTGLASTYGAAGSLVIVLLWVYYSAQIFFFGAEFTCVYTHRYGSLFRKDLELNPEPGNTAVELIVPESFEEKKRALA